MGPLRTNAPEIDFSGVRRQRGWQGDARRGDAVFSGREPGRVGARRIGLLPIGDIHDFNLDGAFGARRHARWVAPFLQTVVAHVAFAHHASLGVILGNTVRAVPSAVLAPD